MIHKYCLPPKKQAETHIQWMIEYGVTDFDIGVLSRVTDQMQNRINIASDKIEKMVGYARYQNSSQNADILIRPSRDGVWPMIFADDVDKHVAYRFARQFTCLMVQTSREGGFHLWIPVKERLTRSERLERQRMLVIVLDADKGSVSGEHYGRLAGFVNHKRDKQWCNLHAVSTGDLWSPGRLLPDDTEPEQHIGNDDSESGKEYGFACYSLRHGVTPEKIISNIESRARARGKREPDAYAARTVAAAQDSVSQERC